MQYPNFDEEKKLWEMGYDFVVGLDEAGRGPLAGPVTAAAVIFNYQFSISNKFSINQLSKIKDSKQLSEKQRERIYKVLTKHPKIFWGIGVVSEKIIDKINILEATKLAMQKAVEDLNSKLKSGSVFAVRQKRYHFLIVDGNMKINFGLPYKSIVKADQKVFSCAAASIIAKVTRDRLMQKMHKKYPNYGFDRHKGYGTKEHYANLVKHGPCKIHRKTFKVIHS